MSPDQALMKRMFLYGCENQKLNVEIEIINVIAIEERTTMKTLIEEFDIKAIDPTVIELEKRLIDHESGHVMKTVGHLMTIDIQITVSVIEAIEIDETGLVRIGTAEQVVVGRNLVQQPHAVGNMMTGRELLTDAYLTSIT